MNRVHQSLALAAGGLIGAAGAFTAMGFQQEQPGTQPSTDPTHRPGYQPGTQPGEQPGTQPGQSQPGQTQPGQPDYQPSQTPRTPGYQPGLSRPGEPGMNQPGQNATGQKLTREQVDSLIASWPAESKKVAESTLSEYGPPDGYTQHELIWENPGPWREVVVSGVAVDHNFPTPHKDCIMGFIDMKVPQEKIADLAKFDGSLFCFRTPGLVASMCNSEEMNFAAINLAHDIVQGSKSVDEARQQLAKVAMGARQGTKDPITQGLQFQVQKGGTADPGQSVSGQNQPGQNNPDLNNPDQSKPGEKNPSDLNNPGQKPRHSGG